MDRPVKLSELIGIFFTFVASLLTAGFVFGTRLATVETKTEFNTISISQVKAEAREDKERFELKLDGMNNKLDNIQSLLHEKQDRKK
jgi:uncharacterized coiled-coil protein SlyX